MRALYYIAAFPEWLRVVEVLRDEHGWDPCYLSVLDTNESEAAQRFPDVLLQDKFEAIRAIAPHGYERWSRPAIGEDVYRRFEQFYPIFMRMLDRLDMEGSFTFEERNRQFYRHLTLWWNAISELRPDVAVFSNAPHGPADYMMYAVCQVMGVPTLVFTKTTVSLLGYVRSSLEEAPAGLADALEHYAALQGRGETPELSPVIDEQFRRLTGDYSQAEPWYMAAQRKQTGSYSPKRGGLGRIKGNLNRIVKAVPRVWKWPSYAGRVLRVLRKDAEFVPFLARPLKVPGHPHEDSWITKRQWKAYRERALVTKRSLAARYRSLSVDPDLSVPYVYVPLHYQPEATTCPEAGLFVDQRLMVSVLAQALPKGWKLYVREHPSQFADSLLGEQGRTLEFYDDLAAIPGVVLVGLDVAPFDLIDGCRAVATATGTPGWEGVVRGKPALAFGNAWYAWCPGVTRVRSVIDAQEALKAADSGFTPSADGARAFLAAMEAVGFRGDINRTAEPRYALTPEENARALAAAAIRSYSGLNTESGSS